jgi:hypothetical protein
MTPLDNKNAALADKLAAALTIRKNQGMVWRNDFTPSYRLTDDDLEVVIAALRSALSEGDAARYRWLRARDLETVNTGGVFIGKTPDNLVLNLEDADRAIDEAMSPAPRIATPQKDE